MNAFEKHIDENPALYEEFLKQYGSALNNLFNRSTNTTPSNELIEVKPDIFEQLSLFAITDIPKNTMVTLYPSHFTFNENDELVYQEQVVMAPLMETPQGKAYYKSFVDKYNKIGKSPISLEEDLFKQFFQALTSDIIQDIQRRALFSHRIAHPFIFADIRQVGHMIQDARELKINSTDTIEDIKKNSKVYAWQSYKKSNCILTELGIVSFKDIKKGDQLFASYGIPYFLQQQGVAIDKIYDKEMLEYLMSFVNDF